MSTPPNSPRGVAGVSVRSLSCSTAEEVSRVITRTRSTSDYSATIAHHRRPTDRISYLCDNRYVVDDTETAGEHTAGVEVSELGGVMEVAMAVMKADGVVSGDEGGHAARD